MHLAPFSVLIHREYKPFLALNCKHVIRCLETDNFRDLILFRASFSHHFNLHRVDRELFVCPFLNSFAFFGHSGSNSELIFNNQTKSFQQLLKVMLAPAKDRGFDITEVKPFINLEHVWYFVGVCVK